MGSNGRYNKIISIKKMWSSKERCGVAKKDVDLVFMIFFFFPFGFLYQLEIIFFFCSPLGCVAPNLAEITYFFFCWEEEETTGSDIPNVLQHSHTHTEEETAKQQSTTFNSFYYSGLYIYYTNIQLIIYR